MVKCNALMASLIVMVSLTAGCSGTRDVKYYSLDSSDYFSKVGESTDKILFVKSVNVPEYLDTKSFIFRVNQHEVIYTNDNKWVEDLSVILDNSLLKNLRNSTDAWFVTNDVTGNSTAELSVKINNFEINSSSTAVVDFDYKFVLKGQNMKMGTIHQEKTLDDDGYDSMVAALNNAWQTGISEIVLQTLK